MDTPTARAQAFWQDANKLRIKILRDIEQLKKGSNGKSEEEQLKKLEDGMAQFRLRFVYTIQQDPQYAFQQDAEGVMWKLHIWVNMAYRTLLNDSLKGQQHVVTRRKVEKLYINYLNIAHAFYKSYFQRLQSLHGVPQIPRINSLLQLEAVKVDGAQSAMVPVGAVQKSFYATLLHLGDLARWRHKARPKPDGLTVALMYYDIAHDLQPTSGAAHHQMGIISTEKNDHLLVVYHFYRSLAIESPHGNSIQNLEHEFSKLLPTTTPSKRPGLPDPNEAFSNWFVRLHARFYKGKEFSGQAELEKEVMHRLEIMLKKPGALPLTLKMVLINMAAYHVAKSRVEKKWSVEASASCQFILRLNVRWVLALSSLLHSELQEFIKAAPPGEDDAQSNTAADQAKAAQKFSAFTENILPLMRIYMAWLYIYRADVVDYQDHLGPYVFDMYRALAQSLSLVAKAFSGEQMSASPYLLEEDVIALGMKPFADPSLPSVCRIHYLPGENTFKPHWEDCGLTKGTAEQEMRSRVFELMHIGFSFAFDERFPLVIIPPAGGSNEAITISYVAGGKSPVPVPEPATFPTPVQANVTENHRAPVAEPESPPARTVRVQQDSIEQLGGQFQSLRSSDEGSPAQHARGGSGATAQTVPVTSSGDRVSEVQRPAEPEPYHPTPDDLLETETDLSLYAQMHSMVADLVDEDTPQPQSAPAAQAPYSYGTRTPDGTFNNTQTQRQNISTALGQSVSPSWDAFMDQSRLATGARSTNVTPQYGSSSSLYAGSTGNAFGAMAPSTLQPNVPAFTPRPRPPLGADPQPFFPNGSATALGNGAGHIRQRFGGSTDSSGTSSFFSPNVASSAYQIATGVQDRKSISPPVGFGLSGRSFSTSFSPDASGLPPVNGNYGLLRAQLDGAAGVRGTSPFYQPIAVPSQHAAYEQPNNGLGAVCNGNVYDATTAFGRGDISNKDDPTHFRNAVKNINMAAAVAEADKYDMAVLESAFADDRYQPET